MTSPRRQSRRREPIDAFLEMTQQQMKELNALSAVVQLEPLGDLEHRAHAPSRYRATFRNIEHFERRPDGKIVKSRDPVEVWITIPRDYLLGLELPPLNLRVAYANARLVHPNFSRGVFCLGSGFRPGTRLEGIVTQLYGIVSGRIFATEAMLDEAARDFFLDNLDLVRGLVSPPLWLERAQTLHLNWSERKARRETEEHK